MADWRKVAMAAFLADGKIDEVEVKVLKKELYADNKIDADEVKFLIELANTAQKKAKGEALLPAFEKLFFKAIEDNVLKDGKIDAAEAKWLRDMLFADGKIDESEMKFLDSLKKKAKDSVHADFTKLYDDAKAKAAKAKAKAAKPAAST